MSLQRINPMLTVGWFAIVSASLASRLLLVVAPFSAVESAGWLAAGLGPALILWATFRGAPPATIAEVLYAAEHPAARASDIASASKAHDAR